VFAKDTLNTFLIRFGMYFLMFAVSIIVSNLGQEVKGAVALLYLTGELIRLVSHMGLAVATVYYLRKGPYDVGSITRSMNLVIPILSLAWTIVILPILYLIHRAGIFGEIGFVYVISCLAITYSSTLFTFQLSILNGLGQIRKGNYISLAYHVSYLALLLVAVLGGLRETWVAVAAMAASFTICGVVGVRLNRAYIKPAGLFEYDSRLVKDLAAWGLKSQVGALFRKAANRTDLIMTNIFGSLFVAGVYSVALNWAELCWFVPFTLYYVLFPHASGREESESVKLTNRVSRLSIVAMVFLATAIGLAFPFIERIFYRPDYSDALGPLLVLLPGVGILGLFFILMGGLDGLGKPLYGTYASLVNLFVMVLLNRILVPEFGMYGAAVATSVSGLITFLVVAILYLRTSRSTWSEILILRGGDISFAVNSIRGALGIRGDR